MCYRIKLQQLKEHLLLAYPIMISQLSHISIGVADNIMVGWLGAVPLAAASLANSFEWPVFALGLGISYGMTPLVAAANAKHNYKKNASILKHALITNGTFGVLLCIIFLLASPLLHHIGQEPAVSSLARPYLYIITASIIPLMIFQTFREYAEGLSFTKGAMYINVSCSLMNIALNYLLIYGKLGFNAMGLNGAGWATLISRIIMAFAMGTYVFTSSHLRVRTIGFNLKNFIPVYFTKLLRLGLPTGLEFTLQSIVYTLAVIMVGWIGAETQAAYIIAINLWSISFVVVWGIALATTVRVGNQFGIRNFRNLRQEGFTGLTLGAFFMLISSLVFMLGCNILPAFYTSVPSVLSVASNLIVIGSFFQLSDGLSVVGVSALRGMEDTTVPFILTTISHWIVGLPLGYILGFKLGWGVYGIWWGLCVASVVSGIAMFIRFEIKSRTISRHK